MLNGIRNCENIGQAFDQADLKGNANAIDWRSLCHIYDPGYGIRDLSRLFPVRSG